MAFRYSNNVNTHKKKVDAIKKTRTNCAVSAAHEMRNSQNVFTYNKSQTSKKIDEPGL